MAIQRTWLIVLVILLLGLTACGAAASEQRGSTDGEAGEIYSAFPDSPMEAEGGAAPSTVEEPAADIDADAVVGGSLESQGQNSQNAQAVGRKIVYTASMVLEVDEPRQQAQALYGVALRYGGFVSGGNVYEYGEDEDGNPIFRADMQLRVNADQFVQAQEELRGMAIEIVSEQVSTQDVTAEYTDVESRIRNLERLEEELQLLLSEARERSDDMDEVLNIYRELTDVRGQIEVLQGRINVLSDLVGLATINVTLIAPETTPTIAVVDETWDPGITMREALRAFTEDLQGFADSAIWFIIVVLPRLLIVGLVLFVLYLMARRVWKWARPYLMPSGPTITPPPS